MDPLAPIRTTKNPNRTEPIPEMPSPIANQGTSVINNFVSLKYYYTWKYSFNSYALSSSLLSLLKSNGCESACWSANKLCSFQAECGWSILSAFFLCQVVPLIHCETWNEPGTSEAERSFANLQDLMEQYNSEKLQLESISGEYVQVLSAFMSSYDPLRLTSWENWPSQEIITWSRERYGFEAGTLELGASSSAIVSVITG